MLLDERLFSKMRRKDGWQEHVQRLLSDRLCFDSDLILFVW